MLAFHYLAVDIALLFKKLYMYLEIDECITKNGGCKHNCTNTEGSFYCSMDTNSTYVITLYHNRI